jgi:hypothetical protein
VTVGLEALLAGLMTTGIHLEPAQLLDTIVPWLHCPMSLTMIITAIPTADHTATTSGDM